MIKISALLFQRPVYVNEERKQGAVCKKSKHAKGKNACENKNCKPGPVPFVNKSVNSYGGSGYKHTGEKYKIKNQDCFLLLW